jgi:hypothetical protein
VELEQNNSSSSSTSLSRTTAWHSNSIGKHAWLAGQATIASTQKQGEEKELTGGRTEEHGRRPWRRHDDDAAAVVAVRPPSRGCDGEGGGIVLTTERPSIAWRRCQGCRQPSNRRGDKGDTASTVELGQELQRGSPE